MIFLSAALIRGMLSMVPIAPSKEILPVLQKILEICLVFWLKVLFNTVLNIFGTRSNKSQNVI